VFVVAVIRHSICSGEITKQNAHKYVTSLEIQSLMNIFGFNEKEKKKKKLYEGGLEPLNKSSTTRPWGQTRS